MSELTTEQQAELAALKKRAKAMGIPYSGNVSLETMRERVNSQLQDNVPEEDQEPVEAPVEATKPTKKQSKEEKFINEAKPETAKQRKARLRKEASKLVRVVVTCYDPKKRNHKGDFFTVSNSVVGSFRRFIPYNNHEGWHVEQAFVDMLREKVYQTFEHAKDHRGNDIKRAVLTRAYSVEILPPLTESQLKDLAQRQAMAQGA